MRKATMIIAAVLLILAAGCASKKTIEQVKTIEVIHEIAVEDKSSNELFDGVLDWARTEFHSSKIETEDRENGKLVARGYFYVSYFLTPDPTWATIEFTISDGSVVARFANMYYIDERIDETEEVEVTTKSEIRNIREEVADLMGELKNYLETGVASEVEVITE